MSTPESKQATPVPTMPSDTEAERHLLSGILASNALFDEVGDLSPEDFYSPVNREVFTVMAALWLQAGVLDPVTLVNELRATNRLEQAGGSIYVDVLQAYATGAVNVGAYAKIIQDKALLRAIATASLATYRAAIGPVPNVQQFADEAGQSLLLAVTDRAASDLVPIGSLVGPVFKELEEAFERQDTVTGVPTGLEQLDEMTGGWQRGDLIIIGGRPSMGKSALAVGAAVYAAERMQLPAAVFSQEMNNRSLVKRIMASEARVNLSKMRTGRFDDGDWRLMALAADRLHKKVPIYLREGAVSVMGVRSACRKLKARKGLGLVVIDYLQLMDGDGKQNREQEIAGISKGLKSLAVELDVPVIALAQLSRSLEKRDNKRPIMSDLRDSGQVEQDADVICFIYRDEVYNPDEKHNKGLAEIIVAKQRNGEIGTVEAAFLHPFTRFENLAGDRQQEMQEPPARKWG